MIILRGGAAMGVDELVRFSAPVVLTCYLIFMSTCRLAGSNELQRPAYFQICNVWKEVVTMIAPSSQNLSTSCTRHCISSRLLPQTTGMMELPGNSSDLLVEEPTLCGSHNLNRSCVNYLEM